MPTNSAYDPMAHLNFEDVAIDRLTQPSLLKIRLKASKTDPLAGVWMSSLDPPETACAQYERWQRTCLSGEAARGCCFTSRTGGC